MPLRDRHILKWSQVLAKFFGRQAAAMISRVVPDATIETVWIDGARWDGELSADLYNLNTATATVWAQAVSKVIGTEISLDRMAAFLMTDAKRTAAGINFTTQKQLAAALAQDGSKDSAKAIFDAAQTSRSEEIAASKVTSMANFGAHEGAKQGGLTNKTWQHNGGAMHPREEHIAMSGETVGMSDVFSNGLLWPGDPTGGAEENAYCTCSVLFGRE
jgi:hypothetical protein